VSPASVGIALSSEKYRRAEDFLRDADTAMYRTKSQGRARHQLFDAQMHEQAMERLRVEAGLRRALKRGELALYDQPIVSLETGAVLLQPAAARRGLPGLHPRRAPREPAAPAAAPDRYLRRTPLSWGAVRAPLEAGPAVG